MVLRPLEVKEQIQRYVAVLRRYVQIERVLLYGSYAYGTPREESDIDLAIVSPDFTKMGRLERLEFLERIAWAAKTHKIEPVGFTDEELQGAGNTNVLSEIRDRGALVDLSELSAEPVAARENRADYAPESDESE